MNILKPGTKVKVKNKVNDFPGIYTVGAFIEDVCGEGCCSGYELKEMYEGLIFWPDELEEIINSQSQGGN